VTQFAKSTLSGRLKLVLPEIRRVVREHRLTLALGLFCIVANRITGLVLPASTKYLIDEVLTQRRLELFVPLLSAVLIATAAQGLTAFGLRKLLASAALNLITRMRCDLHAHICRLPLSFHESTKTGVLVSRVMNDVEGLRNFVGSSLVDFLGSLLTAAVSIVFLFRISPLMTVMVTGLIVVYAVALKYSFAELHSTFREQSKLVSELSGRLSECFGGIRIVKGYCGEEREQRSFAEGTQRVLKSSLKANSRMALTDLIAVILMGVMSSMVLYLGSVLVMRGSLTLGGFVTFTVFVSLLVAPMMQLSRIGSQLTEAIAAIQRISEITSLPAEASDPRRTVALGETAGSVVFDNVSFAYQSEKQVLHNISFRVEPGTVTALVGPSGAGKSTIIGLIAAFHVPTKGTIRIDGVDVSTVRLESYRSILGLVLQETFLFDGTIRENVAFACPDASEERILNACKIARVDEFADRLEAKYETIIGERGVKLSGGQRQRVSIARAIVADPRVLILDEATSNLDSESEAYIQESLAFLMQSRTTFVIAHRLSTVRRADHILVIEDGRIIERGTHKSLTNSASRYRHLYEKQILAELTAVESGLGA